MDKHLPPTEEIIFALANGVLAAALLLLVILPQHLALYTVLSIVGIAFLHPVAQLFGVPIPNGAITAALARRTTRQQASRPPQRQPVQPPPHPEQPQPTPQPDWQQPPYQRDQTQANPYVDPHGTRPGR